MKNFFIAIIFGFTHFITVGQIVFNGSVTKSGSGVGSLTFTKTITAGNNVLLIVGVTAQDKAISSVTWGGTAMTQFTIGTRNSMRVALYYKALGDLAATTTSNVVVTFASNTDGFAGAADYTGVWQAAPFVNPTVAQAKSTTPSVTFTSAAGHKAIGLLGDIAASPTANGSGQTQYWSFTGSHANRATEKNGAASVTLSHTLSANEDWVMLGGTMQDHAVISLPIELSEFTAKRESPTKVCLRWTTRSELNNDHFDIEKSEDALNWSKISEVQGSGTTKSPKEYKFYDDLTDDEHALYEEVNTIYYRLKQFNSDGSGKTFDLVYALPFEEDETEMVIYPNPSNGTKVNIHMDIENLFGEETLQVLTSHGTLFFERLLILKKGDNDVVLDSNFEKGTYIVRLVSGEHVLHQKRLVVN